MSRQYREALIHRKYVLKSWVPKETGWEVEMQKKFPLNKDELAVLDYLNTKQHELPRLSTRTPAPETRPTSRPEIKSKDHEREKKRIARDSRWSHEIICDGQSVRLAAIKEENSPRLHRAEKIINDGREGRKRCHRTKKHVQNKEEESGKRSPSTREEIVCEAWENVGSQLSRYIDSERHSRNITDGKDEVQHLKGRSSTAKFVVRETRRWKASKVPSDSLRVGKSSIAAGEKRARASSQCAELDGEKGLEIDRIFGLNFSEVRGLEPRPMDANTGQAGKGQTEVMDIDQLLGSSEHYEIPVLQPLVPTPPSLVTNTEASESSEDLLIDFSAEAAVDGSIRTLLEKGSIGPAGGSMTEVWQIIESL